MKLRSALCGQPVGLFVARCVLLFEALNPPILENRRIAPYNVPVLSRTRPSLNASTSLRSAYPCFASEARLVNMSTTGSLSGLLSVVICRMMTCCHVECGQSRRRTLIQPRTFTDVDILRRFCK